jgi:crossover junction endodeoxyribonuclease RuvC
MIRSMLDLGETPMIMDASDALAIAVCHLHRFRTPALKTRDWKSFIAAHPDRVRK